HPPGVARLVLVPVAGHHHVQAGHVQIVEVAAVDRPGQRELAELVLGAAASAAADAPTGADRLAIAGLHVAAGQSPVGHSATRIAPTTMVTPATRASPSP